jgi:hypothetical protein
LFLRTFYLIFLSMATPKTEKRRKVLKDKRLRKKTIPRNLLDQKIVKKIDADAVEAELVEPVMGRPREGVTASESERKEWYGFDVMSDKIWAKYCEGWTLNQIAAKLGVSPALAWKRICSRTEYLRDNASPEVMAARTGQMLDAYFGIRNHAFEMMKESESAGPAWAAIALKSNELIAKLYGLGQEKGVTSVDVGAAHRLGQISSRLMLLGPNAHPSAIENRTKAAMSCADVRPATVEEAVQAVDSGGFVEAPL